MTPISKAAAVLVVVAACGAANVARADCVHDGKTYPEGTRIGVLVCEGGTWVERP